MPFLAEFVLFNTFVKYTVDTRVPESAGHCGTAHVLGGKSWNMSGSSSVKVQQKTVWKAAKIGGKLAQLTAVRHNSVIMLIQFRVTTCG